MEKNILKKNTESICCTSVIKTTLKLTILQLKKKEETEGKKIFTHKFPLQLQIKFERHPHKICLSNSLCDPQKTGIILGLSLPNGWAAKDHVNQHMSFLYAQTSYYCSVHLFPFFFYLDEDLYGDINLLYSCVCFNT